jgi:signal transduction histidine kinase
VGVGDRAEDGLARSAGAGDRAQLTPFAAHEINNSLDALLNLLYLLEAEPLSENGRHYLTVAQEEGRRISLIARETLNEHRVETTADRTDVAGLFASVLDLYKQRFDSSGITVATRYAPDCTIPILARQLRQVFSNLLLNAMQATLGGGKIEARVSPAHERSGSERHGVLVTLADNGSGMSPKLLHEVLEKPVSTKGDGHGMGLSLVRDVVRHHHGWLRVRSSTHPSRHGTVFTVFLPAV